VPDTKRMISEVAAENGIRVEPGDPLFALVTVNRMVFEEAAQIYYDHNQQLIVEFKESMKKGRSARREHAGREGEGGGREDA
jgi:hypothetical protein